MLVANLGRKEGGCLVSVAAGWAVTMIGGGCAGVVREVVGHARWVRVGVGVGEGGGRDCYLQRGILCGWGRWNGITDRLAVPRPWP
jgi:hypothetical protein